MDNPVQQHDPDSLCAVLFVWLLAPLHLSGYMPPIHCNGANSEMLLVLYGCLFSVELSYPNEFCNHLEGG